MSVVVDALKGLWHRDLAANPVTEGWVLNLYRAGEKHPQTVLDYFPADHAPAPELADALRRHEQDERKHERLYAAAIREMGEPVADPPSASVFNNAIRECTPGSFSIEDHDPLETRRAKVASFLAHAHFLEKRIARSLEYHLEACERARNTLAARVVANVLADETRHVSYTRDWAVELLPRAQAEAVLEVHRRAEARANLLFSSRQVRDYLRRFSDAVPRNRRLVYRFCAVAMEAAESRV